MQSPGKWLRQWSIMLLLVLWRPLAAQGVPPGPPAASSATDDAAVRKAAADQERLVTLEGSLDATNAYYERGYQIEDDGAIFQPSLTAYVHPRWLNFGDTRVSPYISTWNSMHTDPSPQSPHWWYEADLAAGIEIEHKHMTLDLEYEWEAFPGGAEKNESEFGATLEYHDGWLTKKLLHLPFFLAPHVGIYQSLGAPSNAENGRTGTYLELGLEPTHTRRIFGTAVSFSIPIVLGMGFSDVYTTSAGHNQIAGYVSSGLRTKIPLSLPKEWGRWKLVLGVDYLRLLADSPTVDNRGDRDALIGKAGLEFTY